MKIIPIRNFQTDHSVSYNTKGRENRLVFLQNVYLTGRNYHYPNTLLLTKQTLVSPYDEKVMSLNKESFYDKNEYEVDEIMIEHIDHELYFFFIYNVDNYYHFLYDSIPYLYYYKELQQSYPNIKLLINTSHTSKYSLPLFVKETLELLDIKNIVFPRKNTMYKNMYVGTSFTHGGQSNDAPSEQCYSIWNSMIPTIYKETPKKIYVSRRSQLSKHPENIGTNYTQRRKCVNEDALVQLLKEHGFVELLCEDLSMEEKILYFRNATHIAGFIGGGMANCIFSNNQTRVLCFETPTFLDVNTRFTHSMNHTRVSYIKCTTHIPHEGKYTLYTRVKYNNIIGEIEDYSSGYYKVKISNNDVAGFSQDFIMDTIEVHEDQLLALDKGLNSPYKCDLEIIKQYL